MPYGFVPPPSDGASGGASPPFSGADVVGGQLADSGTEIRDDGDPSRRLLFELSGTTGTVILTPPATAGTYAIATGSNWNPAAAEVVTNKDLSDASNNVSGATATALFNGVTQTVPSVTAGELVNTTQAQTFTTGAKTFDNGLLALRNPAGTFSATLRAGAQTAARDFTFPVTASDTIVTAAAFQTLTSKTLANPNVNNAFIQDDSTILNTVDPSRVLRIAVGGISAATLRTWTAPDASGVVVLDTAAQTLTNKTLTAPTIASITSGAVAQTVPSATAGELVNTTQAQTLTNKTISGATLSGSLFDSTTFFVDDVDPTKQMQLQLSSITTGTTRTLTVPDGSGTIATTTATQTLTNKTLAAPTITGAGSISDTTVATGFTNGAGAAITLPAGAAARTLATLTGAETLSSKTLTTPVIDSITSGAVAQTVPSVTAGELVNTTQSQTLAGKSLTAPTITGAGSISDTTVATGFTNGGGALVSLPGGAVARTLASLEGGEIFTGSKIFADTTLRMFNPAGTFTLTMRADAQTANRNLSSPVLGADDVIVTLAAAQTISGAKTYNTSALQLRNPANTFSVTLNAGAQTAARTYTFPVAATGTIVLDNATQTLTGKTLTSPTITAPTISGAALIADSSFFRDDVDNTKRMALQLSGLPTATTVTYTTPNANGALVVDVAAQTLTNKTLQDSTTAIADNTDATKLARFECSGITTGTTRTYTLPNVSSTILTATPALTDAVDVGSGVLRYRNVYTTNSIQSSAAYAFSLNYDQTVFEAQNTNDTASWALALRTVAAGDSRFGFRYLSAGSRGFFSATGADTQVNQTVQHHLLLETPAQLDRVGLLFQRVDKRVSTFTSRNMGTLLTGPAGIIVDDALPVMRLCPATRNVKGCYGVLSRPAPSEWFGAAVGMELDEVPDLASRGLFATQGEGAMWALAPVVDGAVMAVHHIELGDFLSSGGYVEGYAGRQMSQADALVDDADCHYAWSVARAGFSCGYELDDPAYLCEEVTISGVLYRRAFIPVGFCM